MTERNLLRRTWDETPPITRYIAILSLATTMLVYLEIATVHHLSFSSYHIFNQFHLWRVITPYFYFGTLSIETVLHIVFLIRYSRMLEESISSSEYLMLIFYTMVALKISDYFVYLRMGHCLASCITYIWTKKSPNTQVQLLGCVTFPAFYLSFIVPLLSIVSYKKVPSEDLFGILIGQFIYYFKYVWPQIGYDFLVTPNWVKKIYGDYYQEVRENVVDGNNGVVLGIQKVDDGFVTEEPDIEPSEMLISDSSVNSVDVDRSGLNCETLGNKIEEEDFKIGRKGNDYTQNNFDGESSSSSIEDTGDCLVDKESDCS